MVRDSVSRKVGVFGSVGQGDVRCGVSGFGGGEVVAELGEGGVAPGVG